MPPFPLELILLPPPGFRRALSHTEGLVRRVLLRRRFAAFRAVAGRRRYIRVALDRAAAVRQRRKVRLFARPRTHRTASLVGLSVRIFAENPTHQALCFITCPMQVERGAFVLVQWRLATVKLRRAVRAALHTVAAPFASESRSACSAAHR